MSCVIAGVRGSVCNCDPRNCATCKSREPVPEVVAKRNAWRYALVLRRARKDTRGPSGEKVARR